jgi:hypothetical protein
MCISSCNLLYSSRRVRICVPDKFLEAKLNDKIFNPKEDRRMRKWIIEWVGKIKANNTNMSNLKL